MRVRRATRNDINTINELLTRYDILCIIPEQINSRDIALVAEKLGEIVGFLWIGLMGKGSRGFIDHFVVDEDFAGQGVGHMLALKALKIVKIKNVQRVEGVIRHGMYHDRSGMNALKVAMAADPEPCTHVHMDVELSLKELNL